MMFPPNGTERFRRAGVGMATWLVMLGIFYGLNRMTEIPRFYILEEIFLWVALPSLICFYRLGSLAVRDTPVTSHRIFRFGLIFALCGMLTYFFYSRDILGYVNRGWEQAAYGLNPYAVPIKKIPDWFLDPMFHSHWIRNPSPYGFLFMQLSKGICILGMGNMAATILLFKALNVLAFLLTGILVYRGAKALHLKNPQQSLLLFLWSPLVILQALSCGHNDILVALFSVLACYCLIRGAWLWVLPTLTLAILIKYLPAVLLPMVMIFLVRSAGWRVTAASALLSIALAGFIGLPYLQDVAFLQAPSILENATISVNSLHAMLIDLYVAAGKLFFGVRPATAVLETGIKLILWTGFAGLLCFKTWQVAVARNMARQRLIFEMVLIMFLLICVVSSKFYPWYPVMFFPMALFLKPENPLRRTIIAVSVVQVFAFTVFGQAHILNFLVLMGLPILYGLIISQKQAHGTDNKPPPSLVVKWFYGLS